VAVCGVIAAIYGINAYINSAVAREVSSHCFAEEQRLDQTIRDFLEFARPGRFSRALLSVTCAAYAALAAGYLWLEFR